MANSGFRKMADIDWDNGTITPPSNAATQNIGAQPDWDNGVITAPSEEPKKRSWGEAASDVGVSLLQGGAGLVKTAGELGGLATGNMDNAVTRLGDDAQNYWEDKKSGALKEKIQQRKANIDAQDSTLGKAWTAVKDTVTDPALAVDTLAQNAATLLPGAWVGRGAKGFQAARALAAAETAGGGAVSAAEKLAIEKAAGTLGSRAAIGTGAVQQGADVSQQAYDDAMKKDNAVWDANPDFQAALQENGGNREAAKQQLANQSARATFLPATGISALANALPGADYLERALVGGAAREGVEEGVKYALPKAIVKGALGEGSQEAIEEGGGQFSANVANQQLIDPNQDLSQGVGENAGMGFAGGVLMGAPGGAFHGQHERGASKKDEPDNPGSGDGAGVDPLARPDEARSRKQQIQEEIDLIQSKGSDATQEDLDREKRLKQQLMFEEANERIAREKIKFNGQQNLTNNSDGAGQDAINLSEIAGQLPPQKPSERMGLDPNAGALSDAAALSVDSGASGNLFLPGEDVIPWNNPAATNGAEQVNPASQWDAMDAAQRASVLASVEGMSDRNGNPNVIANRLSQLNWHNMPLGAQEKVNSAITANAAAPVSNSMQQQELQQSNSIFQNPEMQNRDRRRADSLLQMTDIKNNPDYDRLSQSKTPSSGAPMVYMADDQWDALPIVGPEEIITGSDGRKIKARYAIVEASQLQASHDTQGNINPAYSQPLQPGILRTLTNGRGAGLIEAYKQGSAGEYRKKLTDDAASYNTDKETIDKLHEPVLVRVYSNLDNKGDMGAWSNASEGLRLSAAEQANNDARVLGDLHDVVLDDDGKFSPTKNMNLIHRFVNSLPSNEASALRKRDGSVNLPAVEKRIQHAMLAIGFNNDDLINAATEDTEQSRNLMSALTQSAAGFAKLPAEAAIGTKRLVVRAAEMYQKARESGTSVEQLGRQQDLMGGYSAHEEAIADYMEKNIRAPKKVAMVLGWLADYENQAHQSQGSMFGDDLEATKDAAIAYANQRIKQEFGNDANLIREQPATTRQQPATDHGRGTGATTGAHEGATERAGRSGRETFGLTSQTEQQLAEQEAAQAAAKEEAAQREKAAQDKANADAEVGQFTLTGSDRAADVAAAQGQQDIFSGGGKESETPDHATRWQSMSIEDRKAVLKQEGGWPTQSNGLSVIGQQLAQQDWSKLPSGMRDKIQGLMDKTESSQQKTQPAPKQNPETKAVLAEKPEAVQQKANDILREGFSDEQYRMDSVQTRKKIADKLKNAQVSDEKGIKSLTQLWMARVVVGAKQLNMLPSEYYSRFMEGEIRRGEVPDDDSSQLYSEKDDAFGGLSSEQVALLESLGLLSKPQQEVFRELGENQWGERYVRPAGYVSSTQRGNEEVDLRGEKHQFLSDFEASVTGRGSALARAGVLAEIRKLSERVSDILQGRVTKTHSEILSPLGPFKGYEVRANIERDGVSKTLHVEVYGKEQIEAGLTDEPALLFTVSENGEFIVNGPNPNSETFREFQKRGWAEHAHDKAGNIEPDYTRLTPTPGHKTMPMDQLKPLLADVHARVRAWRKEDQVGLYWVRSTGATGGVLGRETAVFFQKGKGTKQGAVNPTTKDITLSEKDSDASTFLHETGHIFLETQIDMAGMENAGAVVKHDADTVLKWFGIAGNTMQERLAAWNAMTLEEKRPFHEQYTESFEQYLMEGKAPSKDLQSAFDNFRRWLKQVYKSIKAFLASHEGAKLNDDMRAVFDRLLATEEQIQEMEKARNAKALAGEKPLLANPAETKAFEEAAQTVVDNVASGNTEIGKAKEPASILNTSQSKYIAAQAKEQGIKKGSPGYDAAIKKLEAAYGEDLNKALAALPFDQFHEWNVKDGSKSETMNRKAWEALRDEYGIEDVSGSNVEPVSDTKTEMDRIAKEREELTGRAEEWESRIDAMTDEQAKGLFDAMNLAGGKSLDIKEALKEEHPDDLDEGYEELKQSNKTDLVASKKEAAKPVSTTNRNEFSIERYDREKDEIVTDRFERGEYVRAMISNNKSTFGEIDGVSHARNKVSIDGVWYSFGSIYKAERPAEPEKKNMAPLSKVIEKANEKYGEGLTEFDRVPEQYSGSKTPAKTSTVSPSSSPEEGQVSQRKTLEPGDVFVTLQEPKNATNKIEDFGEKLEGKRTYTPSFVSDNPTENDIATKPLSAIWPSDAHEKIEDKTNAALVFLLRSELPAKPRTKYKVDRWVKKVQESLSMAKDNFLARLSAPVIASMMRTKSDPNLRRFADRLETLYNIDREQWSRLGSVAVYPNAVSFDEQRNKVSNPFGAFEVDGIRHKIEGAKTVADILPAVEKALGEDKKEAKIAFEVRGTSDYAYIMKTGDKERRHLKDFKTGKEALDYLKNNYDDVLSAWNAVKDRDNVSKADTRRDTNRPRTGADHRKGKDATTEMFEKAFGFRGVEFGKWVSQGANAKERQGMLNLVYDSLHDLAAILNIPVKAISLNGTLGLALGSRGSGNAAAHFERDNLVINLTKTKGAGSLAHEWFHALDNYFSRMRREDKTPPKKREGDYITYKPETYYQKGDQYILAKDFEEAVAAGRDKYDYDKTYSEAKSKHRAIWRQIGQTTDGWVKRDAVRPEVEQAFADLVKALNESPMSKRSRRLDKNPANDYWSRIIERGARAFENYVITKMQNLGYHNDYLANVKPVDEFTRSEDRYPYLLPSEEAPIAEAFDNLFDTIETKEGDDGNVALFNRNGNDAESQQELRDEKEQTFASGLPHNLPAEETTASRTLENKINEWRARRGDIGRVRVREVSAVSLPKQLHRALARFTDTTGTRVVLFRNLTPEVDDFGGVNFRDGTLYINENSQNPITLTAAHEWVHNLKKTNPSAYQELENEVRRQGRLDAWHERNIKEEGFDRGRDHAIEELTAAAVSDALTDPVFLQKLAERDQSAFRRIAKAFLEFLKTLTTSWKDQGSNAYLQDVEAFRDKLVQVLDELPVAKQKPGVIKALFLRVFHGTPHRGIEQEGFKLNKIGTGEGAQVYGWGMYFASMREVAEGYRKALSGALRGWNYSKEAKALGVDNFEDFRREFHSHAMSEAPAAIAARRIHHASIKSRAVNGGALSKLIERFREVAQGQLYSLDLPIEKSDLLDYDKPLREQSQKVKDALIRAGLEGVVANKVMNRIHQTGESDGFSLTPRGNGWAAIIDNAFAREAQEFPDKQDAEDWLASKVEEYAAGYDTGASIYKSLQQRFGEDQIGSRQASEYLQSLGIPGLRYLDGVSRHRPLKDIKREFLAELPEDADFADVVELLGTGALSPKNEALVRALAADEWLGFDYPAQAISAALSKELSNFDASLALRQAVADAQEGGTHNYVIWDENLLTPEAAKIEPMFSRESDDETLRKEFADTEKAYGGEAAYEKAKPSTNTPTITESDLLPLMGKAMGSETLAKVLLDSGLVTGVHGEAALRQLAAQHNGAKFMVAWHGTPHDFDQFSLDKIGTGEGAQAYGYGLYFAGSRSVAEFYRKELSDFYIDGKRFKETNRNISKIVKDNKDDLSVAAKKLRQYASENAGNPYAMIDEAIKVADAIESGAFSNNENGRLYKVEIPEDDTYLLWDKPLSEQSEKVKAALRSMDNRVTFGKDRESVKQWIKITGDIPPEMRAMTGGALYSHIAGKLNARHDSPKTGSQQASEYLHSIGIRGIKYLDGSSRGAGDSNYNYVIFDDTDISITNKYSQQGQIQGATLPDGRIILNLDALTADNFAGVFKHEGFHSTVKTLLGEAKYNQLMKQLESQVGSAKGNTWVDQANAAVPADTKAAHKTEEIAAYAIEQVTNGAKVPGFINRWVGELLSAIRTAIIRFAKTDSKLQGWAMQNLKPEDLARLAVVGLRAKARGAMQGQMREAVAYSKQEADADRQFKETDRAYGGREAYDRAKASGKTKLNYRQWVQVRTPRFKEWFGDWEVDPANASKVVDSETGEPLVVYHGAATGFSTFDERKIGDRDPGFFGDGFYFTPNEGEAQDYADSAADADGADGGEVIQAFLAIQNPFVWDMEAGDGAKATRHALAAMGIARSSVRGNSAALSNSDERRKFAAAMKAAGHDGVIVRDEDGIREVVAFRPNQIKSAIGNNGAFDGSNPDIRYSRQNEVSGFSVADIKDSLSKTFGHAADKLQRLGLVTVVQTEKEAMDLAYKARAEKAGKDLSDFDVKYSETGDVQGFYDKQTGKSFLVADNLTDETASSVLVHEVGVHMAADTTNPRGKQAMDKMIQRAGNLLKLEKSAFMDSVRQRMKEAGETSNEEAAAYIAEEYEANRANAPSAVVQWVKDFIAAVRGWLFQRGVIVKDNMLTAADIAAIARSNVKQAAKRNGIVGLAKTQQTRNVVQELGERYETDLFGNALPPANKRRGPTNTKPESARVSGDIQPTSPLSDTEAPAGDYFVRTIVGQEVARKLGASRITTPEEAAQATQYLYKSAVERLDGIVTDKNGKPLGVVGGFKGELASSSVYPSTIVAEAIRIPGAAAIWFSHNHPSGLANLSRADINISRTLTDIFRGSGIEPMGLLAVAGDMFDYVDADGDQKYPTKIPAPESSAVRVPVIERELGSENSKQYKIEHPQDAIYVGELMRQKGGDGIMLLNSQNEVVAWVPISDVMRGDLRDTGGLAAIYRAISEANAGAAVIVHGGMLEMSHPSDRSITVGQNIAAALSKIDVRVLDIVDSLRMVSSANTGADIARGPVYSRKTSVGLHYSRAAVKQYANRAASELNKTFSSPNTLSWWHKTVGTMYNLAERSPAFKRVFDAAQGFIDDVSHYANDAADFAPTILPKLEKWSDIAKTSIASADNKAIEKPIHEGTLAWTRREDGSPVKVEDLIKESKTLSTDDKIARLLRSQKLQRGVLKMWQGMSPENLQKRVDSFYDKHWLKAGVVWNDSELKQMFGLNDKQVGLYKEYRAAIDRSLDTLARADMLRFVGEDAKDIKDAVMDADNIRDAAAMLTQHLMRKAKEDTDREKFLMELVHGIHERHDKVNELQKEGYAPLSRFGKYTVDVVDPDTGERQYFSMFETKREANAMAEAMRKEFGDKAVSQGTLSDEAYKLFSDMSPETLELFGNMLGLESTGDNTQDIAFQEYLKLTKTNRSAMRRLIHRQGIVGYSQDMPRILANFVYSNARQTAAGLNMGEMGEALNAIPKAQGELKDAAIRLADYVKNPREEAQAVRGLLFAQYLGGSVASAMVNMTQPFAVSFPYLTQFTSVKDSAAQLGRAAKELAQRNPKYDPELTAALHRAVEDGVVSPQEIHQLMAQARGSGTLSIGDGTKTGEAAAAAKNAVSKLAFGWGKVFSMAEQVNRQMTFVAAYRIAKAKGMDNAEAFARKAVVDTQFQYSKANKMQWGRGAVGGTLMTFKTYSIAYVELLHRMYTQGGPEGKRAALLALGVLMLMGGASGLPFEEDMEDVAEALAQKLGYNISIKQKRQEFLSDVFGNGMANFIENGITGLPGIPIDVSGRLGMGNLIPGTGLLKTKTDHTRDVLEIAGPIGDFASRVGSGAGRILSGDVLGGALEMSPVAIRNAVKGIDMASTGMYRDQKGYKVIDTNPVEAASKAIGFQPQSVARIQEANAENQQQKAFYNLRASEIRGLWAQGIFEKDASKVADARSQIADWNAKNPDQRMLISIPSVMRRVKEMSKTKDQRIAASAPRVMRAKMRDDVAEILNER